MTEEELRGDCIGIVSYDIMYIVEGEMDWWECLIADVYHLR